MTYVRQRIGSPSIIWPSSMRRRYLNSWWRHQMKTFSALLVICVGNSPVQWRGALMFSLICVWINGWVNNGEAGDLRRHRPQCDVIVMYHQWCVITSHVNLWDVITYPCHNLRLAMLMSLGEPNEVSNRYPTRSFHLKTWDHTIKSEAIIFWIATGNIMASPRLFWYNSNNMKFDKSWAMSWQGFNHGA